MKIILCLSAVCVALANSAFTSNYYGNDQQLQYVQHVPVIHNGVPVDTPEVQAAKAQHFEAYAKAQVLAAKQPSNGQYTEENHNTYSTASRIHPQQHLVAYSSAAPSQYNYAPVDTLEVQQARNQHFQALAHAHTTHTIHYRGKRSAFHQLQLQHVPIIKNGVPEETPEVRAAKAQHLIAHAYNNYHDDEEEQRNIHENFYGYHIPLISKKGVPVETSDVQLAKQQHKLAHLLAETGTSYYGHGYSEYIPVIGPNGTPYETLDVQAAKASHLLAHAHEQQQEIQENYNDGKSYYY